MFSRICAGVIPKVIRTRWAFFQTFSPSFSFVSHLLFFVLDRLPTVPAISSMMPYSSLVRQQFPALRNLAPQGFQPAPAFTMTVRNLNRNARRPKKVSVFSLISAIWSLFNVFLFDWLRLTMERDLVHMLVGELESEPSRVVRTRRRFSASGRKRAEYWVWESPLIVVIKFFSENHRSNYLSLSMFRFVPVCQFPWTIPQS